MEEKEGSIPTRIDKSLQKILDKIKEKISKNMYNALSDITNVQASRVLAAKINETNFI